MSPGNEDRGNKSCTGVQGRAVLETVALQFVLSEVLNTAAQGADN